MFDLNTNLQFAVHGGGDSDGVAGGVAKLLGFIEDLVRLSPAEIFAKVFPGIAVMDNLHPLLVHFPIALLSLFFILDFIGSLASKSNWRDAASWFLYCGALFAGFTVILGLIAASTIAHGDNVHQIMENHEHLGISVLVLAIILTAWRLLAKSMLVGAANTLFQLFAVILFGLLVLTADLGGLMVYGHGVAVEPVAHINQEAAALHEHGAEIPEQAPMEMPTNQSGHHHDNSHEHGRHHSHVH